MGFPALLKLAIRAVVRPQFIFIAIIVLMVLPLSPVSVDQASAQFGVIGGVIGGGGGGGILSGRLGSRSGNSGRSNSGRYGNSGNSGRYGNSGNSGNSGRYGGNSGRYTQGGMGMGMGSYERPKQTATGGGSGASKHGYRYSRGTKTTEKKHSYRYSRGTTTTEKKHSYRYSRGTTTAEKKHSYRYSRGTTTAEKKHSYRYSRGNVATKTDAPKHNYRFSRGTAEKNNPKTYPKPTGAAPIIAAPLVGKAGGGGPPATGAPPSTPRTPPAGKRPGTGVPAGNERRYVPNEVVVEVAANVTQQSVNELAGRHQLTRLQSFNVQLTGTSIQRLRINDRRTVPVVVRALEADGLVMAAQPNYIATLQEMATPAAFPVDIPLYAPERMRLKEAHQLATGNRVVIGVVDGGADARHPELAGLVVTAFDAIGTGERIHPHGTSIVGAIAARAQLRGTAPGAHILVARSFGTNRNVTDGTTVNILRGIDWVAQRGARVINMSFAGPRDPAIERTLMAARQRGIVLVAAVGNAGPTSPPLYPAAIPGVIAVTATDDRDQIFRGANRGKHVTIAAPGVDLWLPTIEGGYQMISGTSFAAAEVSGLIALLLERNPKLDPDTVLKALVGTARDLGTRGFDPLFGAGLIDPYRAILSVDPGAATAQTPATEGVANQ